MGEPATQQAVIGPEYLELERGPNQWLVEHILPVGGLLNLYGKPKVGKSYLGLGLALAVSNGGKFLDREVKTVGRVLYVQVDTPRGLWAARLESLDKTLLGGIYFADNGMLPYPFNVLGDGRDWLLSEVQRIEPALVILDTIREAHSGDENDSGVMRNVLASLVLACNGSALCILSHARKESPDHGQDLMTENRGSNYVSGRADCIMRLTPKYVVYQGRTIGEQKLKMKQREDGLWEVDGEIKQMALFASSLPPEMKEKERITAIASKFGVSESTVRRREKLFKGALNAN